MGRTRIQVNNRSYTVSCADGEEARLTKLANHISAHLKTLQNEFGSVGDDKLMILCLLMMADELLDANDRVDALEKLLPTKQLAKLAKMAASQAETLAEEQTDEDPANQHDQSSEESARLGELGIEKSAADGAGAAEGPGAADAVSQLDDDQVNASDIQITDAKTSVG